MAGEAEERCPGCDYVVTGIAETCPECGLALPKDRLLLTGLVRTPWSTPRAMPLALGLWESLRHPIRSASACAWRARVSGPRAAAFALGVWAGTIALWPVVREYGLFISTTVEARGRGWTHWDYFMTRALGNSGLWWRLWKWEAWSMTRWWILFGVVAVLLFRPGSAVAGRSASPAPSAGRTRVGEAMCRLAVFAPWMFVLEAGYLAGVWFDDARVIPEPSTIFVVTPKWDSWLRIVWLWRGVAPSLLVGLVFFRSVLGWRWAAAAIGAGAFVPVAINWSIVWSWLWGFLP